MTLRKDRFDAILFDKDGTLFDFNGSWAAWTTGYLARLTPEVARQRALAEAMLFDIDAQRFHPDSPVITGTLEVWVDAMLPHLPGTGRDALIEDISRESATAVQMPVAPLPPLMDRFRDMGLVLGLVTNDGEDPARAHVTGAGILDHFSYLAGYDSGYGGKPGPGMLLGFSEQTGIAPARTLVVGDSLHDLHAAEAAGMPGLGVLTGPIPAEVLAPNAVAVLGSIALLPDWLSAHDDTGA